jgi:hypothetical protein
MQSSVVLVLVLVLSVLSVLSWLTRRRGTLR